MQKISGSGTAFLELDGSVVEYDLAPGQQLVIDTGHLAIVDSTVDISVKAIKGVKNVLFGGEGLFNTVLTGPGHVVLQSMTLAGFIGMIGASKGSN